MNKENLYNPITLTHRTTHRSSATELGDVPLIINGVNMGILSNVTSGRVDRPPLLLVYGPDGVGKTAFAAGAPAPLFLGAESGTNHLNVNRLAIRTLDDAKAAFTSLATESHSFKTAVIDTADWLESTVYEHVIRKHGKPDWTSIEDFGFGKGRVHALEAWKELIVQINAVRDKGMGVIILAHSLVKKFEDPSTPQGYERFQLKLQSGAGSDVAGLLREFVDTVMFMNYETLTSTEDKKRAFGDGTRVLYTRRTPAYDAKNRFGLPAQIRLPEDPLNTGKAWAFYYETVAKSMAVGAEDTSELENELDELASQVTDEKTRTAAKAAILKAKGNAAELNKAKAKLIAITSQGKDKS